MKMTKSTTSLFCVRAAHRYSPPIKKYKGVTGVYPTVEVEMEIGNPGEHAKIIHSWPAFMVFFSGTPEEKDAFHSYLGKRPYIKGIQRYGP